MLRVVPEPGTGLLFIAGSIGLALARRRENRLDVASPHPSERGVRPVVVDVSELPVESI